MCRSIDFAADSAVAKLQVQACNDTIIKLSFESKFLFVIHQIIRNTLWYACRDPDKRIAFLRLMTALKLLLVLFLAMGMAESG